LGINTVIDIFSTLWWCYVSALAQSTWSMVCIKRVYIYLHARYQLLASNNYQSICTFDDYENCQTIKTRSTFYDRINWIFWQFWSTFLRGHLKTDHTIFARNLYYKVVLYRHRYIFHFMMMLCICLGSINMVYGLYKTCIYILN
jgi:hypothetical protein